MVLSSKSSHIAPLKSKLRSLLTIRPKTGMLYYLDSFSNVNTFSSASIHTIKQSFPVPSRVFFILLIKRTLQIFITTAEKRALVTCLPPYKALQTSRSYIYVSFQQITPKLGIFTDSCKDFLPSRVEGLSLTAGHIKS